MTSRKTPAIKKDIDQVERSIKILAEAIGKIDRSQKEAFRRTGASIGAKIWINLKLRNASVFGWQFAPTGNGLLADIQASQMRK